MKTKSQIFQHALNIIQASNIMQKLGNQPNDISKIKAVLQKQQQDRTEQDYAIIIEFMSCIQYFEKIKAKYNSDFMKSICKHVYLKTYGANQNIQVGRTTFIVLSGRVVISPDVDFSKVRNAYDTTQIIKQNSSIQELSFGQSFNEFGIQDIQKTNALTIRTTDLACLDFKIIIEFNSSLKLTEQVEKQAFLKQLSYIQQFSENEIRYLAYKMEMIKLQKNETLYKEQDPSQEWVYIVYKGSLSLNKKTDKNQNYQLTQLVEGEIFGEEQFLGLEKRFFSVKCICDTAYVFKILSAELEKKVWQSESRTILFNLITQKWIYRFQRFAELSKQPFDILEIKRIVSNLEEICQIKLNFDLKSLNQSTIIEEKTIVQKKDRKSISFPISLILQSQKHIKDQLQTQNQNKKSIIHEKIITQNSKLSDNYPKNHVVIKNKILSTIINPHVKIQKISSLNYFNKSISQNQSEYQTQSNMKILDDDEINWGGNSSRRNREKQNEFYSSIKSYASHVKYQNLNLIESQSNYAKQLNDEYEQILLKQQKNIVNLFALDSKSKSDNQLRKEYFLKQLKKMQKRLQVLQMIAKGQLSCQYNQCVNDEGEIVDIVEKMSKDDAYEIVDGKKQPKFNFVTSSNYKPIQKPRFKDFDQQIVEQEEKIKVVYDIVSGKLDPEELKEQDIKEISEEYNRQISMRKKLSEGIQTPTYVKSFSQKLRVSSAKFRRDIQPNFFSNGIKLRKVS